MRGVKDRNILDDFAIDFCNVVEGHAKYIIVSGFVAISSGRVRATEDIDMIIEKIPFKEFKDLHTDLESNGFICIQSKNAEEIYSYIQNNMPVRYTRKNEPIPEMEVKFAKDELDEYQIESREKLELTGLDLWFSSIPMNIAFKEELLKSDKDLKDAEHLRKAYPELADEEEIRKIKKMIRRDRL